MSRARALSAAVVVLFVLAPASAVASANPAPTTTAPTPAAPSDTTTVPSSSDPGSTSVAIGAAQAEAQALENQIAQQQQQLTALSERYDAATVHLQGVHASLARTNAQLAAARRRESVARTELRIAAVNTYMYQSSGSEIAAVFSTPSSTQELQQAYRQAAIGDVAAAVSRLHKSAQRLQGVRARLSGEEAQANTGAELVAQAQRQAESESAASQATLAQVQGQLAQLVAEQAARQAEADAAAAGKASDASQRDHEAGAAATAAQVADALGNGSTVTQATDAANQALGDTGPIGSGGAPGGWAPGEVALQAAESYLGVPYVWGGASRSGVDCSGLVMLAWAAAGVSLPHSAAWQYDETVHVPLDQLQPGDLLFYDLDGTGIDHVVMYVGSGPYGVDTIIQAAHTGTVVSFDPVWYYGLVGAGRP